MNRRRLPLSSTLSVSNSLERSPHSPAGCCLKLISHQLVFCTAIRSLLFCPGPLQPCPGLVVPPFTPRKVIKIPSGTMTLLFLIILLSPFIKMRVSPSPDCSLTEHKPIWVSLACEPFFLSCCLENQNRGADATVKASEQGCSCDECAFGSSFNSNEYF